MKINNKMTLKYGAIHAFYWPTLCSISSFASVYLTYKEFTGTQIGAILALSNILAFLIQPVAASFLDKTKKITLRQYILILTGIIITMGLMLLIIPDSFPLIAIIYVITLTIASTYQPLLYSLNSIFNSLNIRVGFGTPRGVGSIMYAAISALLGFIIERTSAAILPYSFLFFAVLMFLAVYFYKLTGKEERTYHTSDSQEVSKLTGKPSSLFEMIRNYKKFFIFCLGSMCLFVFHFIFNNYTLMIVESLGGGGTSMGICIFIASGFELPVMSLFSRIKKHFKIHHIIMFAGFMFALKSVLTLLATNLFVLYLCQFLQMGGYALLIPASVYYALSLIDEKDRVKGQSFVTSATTAGGIIGSFLGGWLFDAYGVRVMLVIGTISSVIGMLLIFISQYKTPVEEK